MGRLDRSASALSNRQPDTIGLIMEAARSLSPAELREIADALHEIARQQSASKSWRSDLPAAGEGIAVYL